MIEMEIGHAISSPTEAVLSPIPQKQSDTGERTERFVTFQLGESIYAIQAATVAEVSQVLPLTPLPVDRPGLMGISPLRGEIVAKIDLRSMLGEKPANSGNPKAKEIILKCSAPGAIPVSFVVDRLGEIATLEIAQIRPAPKNGPLVGEIRSDSGPLMVVDHRKLLVSIEPD